MNSNFDKSAIFLNDNDYFVGEHGTALFESEVTPYQISSSLVGIVYSSNTSSATCYYNPPPNTEPPSSMSEGALT